MFDVGFWELFILFGLGLIILGPERLPKVAMQVGNWAGQARRMARHLSSQMRSEIDDLDMQDSFSQTATNKTTPDYNRPGVDDLKPTSSADESPTNETAHADPADSVDTTANKAD